MRTPEERYKTDPAFHMLVNLLLQTLHQHDYTMSELREAAALACNIHESTRVRPLMPPLNQGCAYCGDQEPLATGGPCPACKQDEYRQWKIDQERG